jgi:hypothetical protein
MDEEEMYELLTGAGGMYRASHIWMGSAFQPVVTTAWVQHFALATNYFGCPSDNRRAASHPKP